jgi:hypothetical protein
MEASAVAVPPGPQGFYVMPTEQPSMPNQDLEGSGSTHGHGPVPDVPADDDPMLGHERTLLLASWDFLRYLATIRAGYSGNAVPVFL